MRSRAFPGRLENILNQLKINQTILENEIDFVEEILQGKDPLTTKIWKKPWVKLDQSKRQGSMDL